MKHVACYDPKFPRPKMVRKTYRILNGHWQFTFDDLNEGIKKQWYLKSFKGQTILVPYTYQTIKSGIHDETYHETLWYERLFHIDEKELNKQTMLHLDGSDYETTVWVNGQQVGQSQGGYTRHSFDISSTLNIGDNRLTIRINDTFSTEQPRGKQRWKTENFGCWYHETSGLWKDVWLEFLNPIHLVSATTMPASQYGQLSVSYRLSKYITNTEIETIVSYSGEKIYQGRLSALRSHMDIQIDLKTANDQFKCAYWSVEQPNLYDVKHIVYVNGKMVDSVDSYVGIRYWKTDQDKIMLNHEIAYLQMILDQGYDPDSGLTQTVDQLEKDIQLIKALGYNGVRKHQVIADERFYYLCDVYGLYSWLEMPSAYEFSNRMLNAFTNEWIKVIEQYKMYPSIMAYVIFNESWGIFDVASNKIQQLAINGLYALTKSLDDTKFVIGNDGWEHTQTDLLTIHNYTQDQSLFAQTFSNIDHLIKNNRIGLEKNKQLFAHGYSYQGQPILISEYGGVSIASTKGWGYGDKAQDLLSFEKRLKSLTKTIHQNHHISGYCMTQLTDVEQETNGLLTADRKPKISVDKYKHINDRRGNN